MRFLAELDQFGLDVSGAHKLIEEMYWYLKLLRSHVAEVQLLLEVAKLQPVYECEKINKGC